MGAPPVSWFRRVVLASLVATTLAFGAAHAQTVSPAVDGPLAPPQDAAPPAQPAPPLGFTLVGAADQLRLPENTPRLALLIGNASYDQAPPDPDDQDAIFLNRLEKPCSDVRAVAARLAEIGWRKNEIYVLCDQSNRQVTLAISQLVSVVPLEDDQPRLMMLYLAGHGMMANGRNYYFGIDSRINAERMGDRVIRTAGKTSAYSLFPNYGAVDVYEVLGRLLGERKLAFPLLVVVDACRNNPFLRHIHKKIDIALEGAEPGSDKARLWTLVRSTVMTPRAARSMPRGLQILYATPPDNTIPDDAGTGASLLSDLFAKEVKRDVPIREHFIAFQELIDKRNLGMPTRDQEQIVPEGDLYAGGDWCFFGCTRPGMAMNRRVGVELAWLGDIQEGQAILPKSRRSYVVWRAKNLEASRRVLIDVSWCSGDGREGERFQAAENLANRIATELTKANMPSRDSQIFAVRLKEIPAEENASARLQRGTNALYVDNARTEPDENVLARYYVRNNIKSDLAVRQSDRPTRDYIEASFCEGAYTGPRAPRVYFQVLWPSDREIASRLINLLDVHAPDLAIEPTAETMLDRKDFRVNAYPKQTVVRFAKAELRSQAEAVASLLSQSTGQQVGTECYRNCKLPNPGGNIEVWVGSDKSISEGVAQSVAPFSSMLQAGAASVKNDKD